MRIQSKHSERGRHIRLALQPGLSLFDALGSLVDACLGTLDGKCLQIKGPAVEIVSLAGEVRSNDDGSLRASLSGVVADTEGNVYGGPFVAGSNPICMTFEVTLEEWLPAAEQAAT